MKVTIISDTHGKHDELTNQIEPCDIIIHCGDVSSVGRTEQVGAFLHWFDKLPAKDKVFIAGNHDWLFETDKSLARLMVADHPGITYLEDSGVIINGLKIYGAPWQPEFCNWAFNLPRGQALEEKWNLIPGGLDILVTHGAPYGILDKTEDGDLTGCMNLYKRILDVNPRYHLFGHIHEAYGNKKIGSTRFYNCSTCDERYRAVNKPVTLNIKPRR